MRGRRLLGLLVCGALLVAGAPLARSQDSGGACVETPRADPSLPAFLAQEQTFGFHDEELVLCSPGAPKGGTPTHLAARLFVPAGCPPAGGCPGVLVVHGFGFGKETTVADMRDLASRGMYVLSYDVRGQGASGGQADFMGPDTIADEAHVLQWFHAHVAPTKTGVYGISQGGVHALMAAVFNCGPARAAALDSTIPCDAGGKRWVDAIVPVQAPAYMEAVLGDGTCSAFLLQAGVQSRVQPDLTADSTRCLFDGTPPDEAVEAIGGEVSDGGLARENNLRNYLTRLDRIDVPVYIATSYFDRLVPAWINTAVYGRLRQRAANPKDPYFGKDVRLIMSNDAHGDVGANFAVLGDLFTWLERQLKGDSTPLRAAPVASQQEWDANSFRLERDWPIAGTRSVRRYLTTDGRLSTRTEKPSASALANMAAVSTTPWVPVVGSAAKLQTVGLIPGDSLRFETEPLADLTEITGLPSLVVWLATPDGGQYGQLTISLEEVAPDGTATQFARVRRGFSDLSGTPERKLIPISTSSWRIDRGNRLRLVITATDLAEATPSLASQGVVLAQGSGMASRLLLPLVDPFRVPPAGDPPTGAAFAADPLATLCSAFGADCPA
jgi:predicted acyl esterase